MRIRRHLAAAATAALAGSGLLLTGTAFATTNGAAPYGRTRTQTVEVVGVTRGHEVPVRADWDSHSRIVGWLKGGETTVCDGRTEHGFRHVRASDGRAGWIRADEVELVKVTYVEKITYTVVDVTRGRRVPVRADADAHARVVAWLTVGEKAVSAGRTHNGFRCVRTPDGKIGWVEARVLRRA